MSPKFLDNIDLNSNRAVNAQDPQSAQDVATKNYVDTYAQGQTWKNAVRAATTAALPTNTFASNALTATANAVLTVIDGVTLAVNDSVLVKNEVTGANNGIYSVTSIGSVSTPWVLTRRSDADASAEMKSGLSVVVTEGTQYIDSAFVLTTPNPITLNTTALTFSPGPSGGRATGLIGDGSSTSIAFTHGLGQQFLSSINLYDASTNAKVEADVVLTSANVVTITFAVAPSTNAYRIVCRS